MDQRRRFVKDWLQGDFSSMAELCRWYGITRPTAYKWVQRFESQGLDKLGELSRSPLTHPNATPKSVEVRIIGERQKHPRWGPRKLLAVLRRGDPDIQWPAASTAGDILKRNGLIPPRKLRRRTPPYAGPVSTEFAPNALWAADFKGWFRTRDGSRIDPFTLSDVPTRFLLRCRRVLSTTSSVVQAHLTRAFQEYGLPDAIQTDNGSPFASRGVGGLSRLAVWLIRLGVKPQRIKAGHPEENGVHERMHRTLKDETARPPAASPRKQDEAFDRFRKEFNEERPHEALGMRTPSELYVPSPRPFPERLPQVEYPSSMQVKRVASGGLIYWRSSWVYISTALTDEHVGLVQVEEAQWAAYFGPVLLGILGVTDHRLSPLSDWRV